MMSNFKKISLFKKMLLSLFLGCLIIVIIFFGLLEKQLQQKLPLQQAQILTIQKGCSVASFAKH
jgi:Na+/H+ antiporter NhaC